MTKVTLKVLGIKFIVPMRDKPKLFDGKIPWCRIEDIEGKYINGTQSNKYVSESTINEMNLKVLPKNSIIYSCSATIGVVAINTVDLCTNQTFIGLIPSDKINLDYLYYQLLLYRDSLKKIASQTTIPYISREKFENLEIVWRDYTSQIRIADVLSVLDDKIELNNKINAELEAMAKTLYDYWFVQFDFPNTESKPYKYSGGKMVYNETLKREIPEGWEVKNIAKIAKIVDCLHSKKPDYSANDRNKYLLQLENILDNGLVDISYKYFVSDNDYKNWTSRIEINEHDILITNAGRVAATAQASQEIKAGIGRNITAIRPLNINPTYFFLSFRGYDIQKQIKSNTDQGAFFKSFNVKGIKKLNFIIPSKEIEIEFEKIAFNLRRKRELNLKENQELAKLRDWLLPMLMNGQVTVTERSRSTVAESEEQLGMVAEGNIEYGE
ncbi:restriction endonuclease subunit S [Pedobacter sp. MW01-1-1]|uniref:restriction endonuclease subunit S n=1 Tax=Pedobacter sp. MW01-1-1 TaxID=3383027 RepID=UPI003FEF0529